jgi:hypothetical protein
VPHVLSTVRAKRLSCRIGRGQGTSSRCRRQATCFTAVPSRLTVPGKPDCAPRSLPLLRAGEGWGEGTPGKPDCAPRSLPLLRAGEGWGEGTPGKPDCAPRRSPSPACGGGLG